MGIQVYIAPYLDGPEPTHRTAPGVGSPVWKRSRNFLRHIVLRLTPRQRWRGNRLVFGLQLAILGSLAVAVLLLSTGASRAAQGWSWAGEGGLVFLLLAVTSAQAWRDCRARRDDADRTPHSNRLAFRLTNYGRGSIVLYDARSAFAAADEADQSRYDELEAVTADRLQTGNVLLVEVGQYIHADGNVIEGVAIIDEAAVTGHSTEALREVAGGCEVMRNTLVVKGRILVRVTPRRGHPLDWIPSPSASSSGVKPFERRKVPICAD